MNLWSLPLKCFGWSVEITAPVREKCVICVAPHTSNWDFILGLLAYRSVGRKANFLMKEFWFFFPLKYLLTSLGGIPVKKNPQVSLTESIIDDFKTQNYLNLAVTPEGTRSAVEKWRTGFLYISYGANVPIQLGIIDYRIKKVIVKEEFIPSGDIEEDMKVIRRFYADYKEMARYPQKFTP